MKRLMLDVNVVLDVLLNRQPHVSFSARLWALAEKRQAKGFLPAHGVTTIYYLLERDRGRAVARRVVEKLLGVVEVAPVSDEIIRDAFSRAWRDFEDSVCAVAAEACDCDLIVTRDPRGFPESSVPAVHPREALSILARG